VSKLPGKEEKDHEIMLQGDLGKQVAAFLTEQYGIPKELLELKTKGK
jgi:translation initiation factor 1 (eIF-1/SUI1)